MNTTTGLHHITCIAGSAQRNVDFYAGTLGLRLVKQTVNFDDPNSYHLYYGDESGAPGTLVTFFAWPLHIAPASTRTAKSDSFRTGEIAAITLSATPQSLDFWRERLNKRDIETQEETRFGDSVLRFFDEDDTPLEIVFSVGETRAGFAFEGTTVPRDYSLRSLHSAVLCEEGFEQSAHLLTETMNFSYLGAENGRHRYSSAGANGGAGTFAEIVCRPGAVSGRGGFAPGTIHHVAWRAQSDAAQVAWRSEIARHRFNVSPVMDRNYFRSIYFREPGGVLFEIATDAPGFAVDESAQTLGTTLQLPPQFEKFRAQLEQTLKPLQVSATAL